MKRSQNLLLLVIAFIGLLSCNNQTKRTNDITEERSYSLIKRDSLFFRRAYWGIDTLEGKELDLFMNRNPESCEGLSELKKHPLYTKLVEANIILDENLNPNAIDTLPETFDYQMATDRLINVERRLLDDPKQVDDLTYELTFKEDGKVLLVDSLICGFPPDVTFFTRDLEKDGSHELLTVHRWYIVNGDNFDLRIYNLKEKPHQSKD